MKRFLFGSEVKSFSKDLFATYSAPKPTKVKFVESKKEREGSAAEERSGVGLAYFNSVEVSGSEVEVSNQNPLSIQVRLDNMAGFV